MRKITVSLVTASLILAGWASAPVFSLSATSAEDQAVKTSSQDAKTLLLQAQSFFAPLPEKMPGSEKDTPAMVDLGKKLYFEQNISVNKTQSCNDCHPIDGRQAGADNRVSSPGAKGIFGARNSPTVLNAGLQISQFWDGRAADLAEQAKGPPLNPIEMGMTDANAINERLLEMEEYQQPFAKAFPDQKQPVSFDNMAQAVAAFERTLITPARFDAYLKGDETALRGEDTDGLQLFLDKGCVRCHSGILLGGMLYQKLGIHDSYSNQEDQGLYGETGKESDRMVFRVPQLRNVTLTAPYFHDGKVANIAEAIDLMGYLQLNQRFTNDEIRSLFHFLSALSDIQRTTSQPPQVKEAENAWWNPPSLEAIPAGKEGERIRYGYDLINDTFRLLGAGADRNEMRHTDNVLACKSCHQQQGTKQFGIPWVGVTDRYPTYRGREDKMSSIQDRISGCFERSMNGVSVAADGEEMQAIVAYMEWLSGKEVPKKIVGQSRPPFNPPERRADPETGKVVYTVHCQGCHGATGMGYQAMQAGAKGDFIVPPLWGYGSFNNGAGMHRLLTAASFVRGNMPIGTPWDQPVLSEEDAYDVAAYFNSIDRPIMAHLEKDYPKLEKKPIDAPYGPYADEFSQEQHQFGPFQPIQESLKKAGK